MVPMLENTRDTHTKLSQVMVGAWMSASQQAHDIKMMSYQRQCDMITSNYCIKSSAVRY